MVNKTKILSELSKIVLEAMNTLSGLKKEIETIVKIRVEKAINKIARTHIHPGIPSLLLFLLSFKL